MSDEIVFVCNRCGEGFSLQESDAYLIDGEKLTACPECGSFDVEEAARCKICREIHQTYKMKHGVCKGCFADAVDAYKSCLSSLMPWEKEVLEDEYGNIDVTEG